MRAINAALIVIFTAMIVSSLPVVVNLPSEVRFVIGLAIGCLVAQAATGFIKPRFEKTPQVKDDHDNTL